MARAKAKAKDWSSHDAGVWHTCDIAASIIHGRLNQRPEILAPFPMRFDSTEKLLAYGGFDLLVIGTLGDGTYQHNSGFLFATGAAGLALTGAHAVTKAMGNSRRRREAEAAAAPRWLKVDGGTLWVSSHGFYMQTSAGLFPWNWQAIDSMAMVAPADVHVQGQSQTDAISWRFRSDWAELLFVVWALVRHPRHPQLLDGSWLPDGWVNRCQQS